MDISEEAVAAHKRTFMDFLDQDVGKGIYMQAVRDMIHNKRHRLIIDMSDLRNFSLDLARRVIKNPGEYIQPFSDALTEVTRNVDHKYLKEGEQVLIGFEGPFGFHRVTPRDLLSGFIGTMVRVEGIVTKCSLVRPKVAKSVHYCPTTNNFMSREYRDITSNMGLPTGSVYPTRDDNGNLLVTEYGLCKYKDHQMISMQEVPENSAPGQLPRAVDVIVEDDLVDSCKPGDRVAIVGTYKALPGKNGFVQASDNIATAYAELRNAGANAKSGGGTLPITARTLETIIRLSTAHAKLKLSNKVSKTDVEAALKVLNFAIYHKELTEMEEREQERERTRQADHDSGAHHGRDATCVPTQDPMEVDGSSVPQPHLDNSAERMEMFSSLLGRHMAANHLDSLPISAIEGIVNSGAAVPYSQEEIESLLETLQNINRLMIFGGEIRII